MAALITLELTLAQALIVEKALSYLLLVEQFTVRAIHSTDDEREAANAAVANITALIDGLA